MSLEPVNSSIIQTVATGSSLSSVAAIEPAKIAIAEAAAASSTSRSYVGGGKRKASEMTTPSESFASVGSAKASSGSDETDEASRSSFSSSMVAKGSDAKRSRHLEVKFSGSDRLRFVTEWANGDTYTEADLETCFDDRSGWMIHGCSARAPGIGFYNRDAVLPHLKLEQKLLSKNVSFVDLLNSVSEDGKLVMGSLSVSPQQEYYAIHNEMSAHFYLAAQLGYIPNHYAKHLASLAADVLIQVLEEQDALDPESKVKELSEIIKLMLMKMPVERDTTLTKGAFEDIISHIDVVKSRERKELKWAYLRQAVAVHTSHDGAVDYSKVSDSLAASVSKIPDSHVKLSAAEKGHDHCLPKSVVDASEFPALVASVHSGEWKEEEKEIRLIEIRRELIPCVIHAVNSFFQSLNTRYYFSVARSFNLD